ncbi:hypothetical protein [Lacticaseibacillus mingshuiensis]|uniref:DUF624 domain-containing protein n=1 Tax=Lacticaseibacillus mingshuiensis TaxID=2799574 RepID=A0ABW4CKS1_9LACO|nr:hypothetical protein [Lacticaseibacillus mingshuiensis]
MHTTEPRGIVKFSLNLGTILLFAIKVQVLFLAYTLRGAIVAGVFPALASAVKILLRRFEAGGKPMAHFTGPTATFKALNTEFGGFWRASFKEANALLYLDFGVLAVLWLDLGVNRVLIKSAPLQYGLIVLLVMAMIYTLYILTIYGRYELHFWQYFRQAFVISIAHFSDTLAILVGTVVATALLTLFPALSLVALVPLYLTPMVWFSLHACQYVETVIGSAAHENV